MDLGLRSTAKLTPPTKNVKSKTKTKNKTKQ